MEPDQAVSLLLNEQALTMHEQVREALGMGARALERAPVLYSALDDATKLLRALLAKLGDWDVCVCAYDATDDSDAAHEPGCPALAAEQWLANAGTVADGR